MIVVRIVLTKRSKLSYLTSYLGQLTQWSGRVMTAKVIPDVKRRKTINGNKVKRTRKSAQLPVPYPPDSYKVVHLLATVSLLTDIHFNFTFTIVYLLHLTSTKYVLSIRTVRLNSLLLLLSSSVSFLSYYLLHRCSQIPFTFSGNNY